VIANSINALLVFYVRKNGTVVLLENKTTIKERVDIVCADA
jgi:hypothetical protein